MRVFENRLLKRICGPKREEAMRCRTELNWNNCSIIFTLHQIFYKMMKWEGHVWRTEQTNIRVQKLVSMLSYISEGKRPYGKPKRRWKYNIKWIYEKKVSEDVEWIHVTQDRVQWWAFVIKFLKIRISWKVRNFWLAKRLLVSQEWQCSVKRVSWYRPASFDEKDTHGYVCIRMRHA